MQLLATLVSGAASIGGLICFILVLVHFFQSGQTTMGIACIVLMFCGIGFLVAFVKGWMDGVGKVMWIWTGCVGVSIAAQLLAMAAAQ